MPTHGYGAPRPGSTALCSVIVRSTSRSAGRSSCARVVITQRGTVIDTASSASPMLSVRPTQSVSTKPISGVSTTMLGRNRSGSNRVPGRPLRQAPRGAGRHEVHRAVVEERALRAHELATFDQLLALDRARRQPQVRGGAVL